MPCLPINNGFICGFHPVYFYKGFYFEFSNYLGPLKVNKDGEPSKREGMKFWRTVTEWANLPEADRQLTLVRPST